MFNRIAHRTQPSHPQGDVPLNKENEDYVNRIPHISFKNSINLGKPCVSTDRLASSISSEYGNEGSLLLKTSWSNSNLHEGMHSLARSQQGNFLRSSHQGGLGYSMNFASMKMGMKNSGSRQFIAADRRLKNQVLDDMIKTSIRGSQMTTSVRVNEIPCSNQDGKKAKYRLINSIDPQNMFYCSKCSIALVQEGYNVQEISSNKIDLSRRKHECQDVLNRIESSEARLRQQLMRLEGETYTHALSDRMHKVQQVYDVIILIIEQMKAKDIETTRRSVEQANKVKQMQIHTLRSQIQKLSEVYQYIQGTMNQALRQLPETEYRSVIEYNIHPLKQAESYKSLSLMIKDEPVEKILETIFEQISEHFQSMRIGGGNLSSISSNIIEEQSNDFTLSDLKQKPFRNLFADEDVSFNR